MPDYNRTRENERRLRQIAVKNTPVRIRVRVSSRQFTEAVADAQRKLQDIFCGPEPIRGGTYFYCPWQRGTPDGLESCGVRKWNWATGTRFNSERAYRRHWRRYHSNE